MNIYEKLEKARFMLYRRGFHKSGYNDYSEYAYYELADFLPNILEVNKKTRLFSQICFTPDLAILSIIDVDEPEKIIQFTSPMSTAKLKACHDIQNLGAVQTYLRRYLYILAYEICETDFYDKGAVGLTQDEKKRLVDVYGKDTTKEAIKLLGYEKADEVPRNLYDELLEFAEGINGEVVSDGVHPEG